MTLSLLRNKSYTVLQSTLVWLVHLSNKLMHANPFIFLTLHWCSLPMFCFSCWWKSNNLLCKYCCVNFLFGTGFFFSFLILTFSHILCFLYHDHIKNIFLDRWLKVLPKISVCLSAWIWCCHLYYSQSAHLCLVFTI